MTLNELLKILYDNVFHLNWKNNQSGSPVVKINRFKTPGTYILNVCYFSYHSIMEINAKPKAIFVKCE